MYQLSESHFVVQNGVHVTFIRRSRYVIMAGCKHEL